jgi:alpha-L-fucosidase
METTKLTNAWLVSHCIEHWWFMNGGRKLTPDVNDPRYFGLYGPACEEDAMSPEFMIDWLMRTMEPVDQYQP